MTKQPGVKFTMYQTVQFHVNGEHSTVGGIGPQTTEATAALLRYVTDRGLKVGPWVTEFEIIDITAPNGNKEQGV
jgi:hypothetical protein